MAQQQDRTRPRAEWREPPARHWDAANFMDEPAPMGWRTILLAASALGGLGALLALTLSRAAG